MSKQPKLPKKHHYVPQSYLCGFSVRDRKVWIYDKLAEPKPEFRWQSVRAIAYEKDFYRFKTEANEIQTLENFFSDIEAKAKQVFDKLENKRNFTDEDRQIIAAFVTFQWLRTPEFKQNDKEVFAETARKTIAVTLRSPKWQAHQVLVNAGITGMSDKEIDDLASFADDPKRCRVQATYSNEFWLGEMLELFEEFYPIIAQYDY